MSQPTTILSLTARGTRCIPAEDVRDGLTAMYPILYLRLPGDIITSIIEYVYDADNNRDDWVPKMYPGTNVMSFVVNKLNLRGFSYHDNMFSKTIYGRRDLIIPGVLEPTQAIVSYNCQEDIDTTVRPVNNPDILVEFDSVDAISSSNSIMGYCADDVEIFHYPGMLTLHGERYCVKITEHYEYSSVAYYMKRTLSTRRVDARSKVGYYLCEFV